MNTCPVGSSCNTGADCDSGACAAGQCQAPSCFDGVQNGGESFTDCGAVCDQKCWAGYPCFTDGDCIGTECSPTSMTCVPNCFDTWLNGDETDPDCGGSCAADCPVGGHCLVDADCSSNDCDPTGHCAP
jgi:hypothetical protein